MSNYALLESRRATNSKSDHFRRRYQIWLTTFITSVHVVPKRKKRVSFVDIPGKLFVASRKLKAILTREVLSAGLLGNLLKFGPKHEPNGFKLSTDHVYGVWYGYSCFKIDSVENCDGRLHFYHGRGIWAEFGAYRLWRCGGVRRVHDKSKEYACQTLQTRFFVSRVRQRGHDQRQKLSNM